MVGNMNKKSIAAKRRVARNLAQDPNYYKKWRATVRGGFGYMMEKDPARLKEISVRGGLASAAKRAQRV